MFNCKESNFSSFDQTQLFYRVWEPQTKSKNVVIILHRGHEHSGRVAHLVKELGITDTWYFSFDLRGHGRSPGERGWAPSFDTWVKDLNAFSIHIRQHYNLRMEDTVVVANSVGSVMGVQWVHDYAPGIKGLALAAPAFSINLYVPFALAGLRFLRNFSDKASVSSYVRSGLLTRDPVEAKAYDDDKLITKKIAVNVLVSLFDSVKRLMSDAHTIEVPTLILTAGNDFIVNGKIQQQFFDKISSKNKKIINLPGFRHALFHEKDREQVLAPVREFLQERFAEKKYNYPAIIPEAREFSVKEFQALKEKPTQLKGMKFYFMRKALEIFGPLSKGMEIGLKYGFDSGTSLDYVYRNKPEGKFLIGTLIDYIYLNSTGWRGVRDRKQQLKETLKQIMQTLNAAGKKPVVLDCAAGHGRYLFEAANEVKFPVELQIRDINPRHIENAKALAASLNVKDVQLEQADAFDPNSFATIKNKPNVVVISGLFELFSDNQLLHSTLRSVKSIMQDGGYIVYTGQPWHPQLEVIARVLNNHQGFRWVMRPRVQAELDELVKHVGFSKLDTSIDDLGIFTVSVAQNTAQPMHDHVQP